MGDAGSRSGTFWLAVGDRGGRPEVLLLGAKGETLPVFGFEEEAHLFLRLGGLEGRWRTSEIAVVDLVSALAGPLSGVRCVALDPLPKVGFGGCPGAGSLCREEFIDRLALGRGSRPRPTRERRRVLRRCHSA